MPRTARLTSSGPSNGPPRLPADPRHGRCVRTGHGDDPPTSSSPEVTMTTTRGSLAAAVIAACLAGGACGPLRRGSRPEVRGPVAAVQARAVDIRHKTGRTYRVELTRETRIIHDQRP